MGGTDGLGKFLQIDVHALEGRERHFLHLQRLHGGGQGFAVLVKPELHGFQFFDAFVDFFDAHCGGHPAGERRQCSAFARLAQLLEKIVSGNELAKTKSLCVAHGNLL